MFQNAPGLLCLPSAHVINRDALSVALLALVGIYAIVSIKHQISNLGYRQLALRPEMLPCAMQTAAEHVGGLTNTWQAAVNLTTAACVSAPWEDSSCKTSQDQVMRNSAKSVIVQSAHMSESGI